MLIEILGIETTTAFLAIATTVHLALLLLRMHRNPAGRRHDALLLPSLVFAVTPWLFPTVGGVAAGIATHLMWFIACERLVPRPPAPAAVVPAVPRPVPAPRPTVASQAPKPAGWVKTPVIAVFRETPDITTFRMARPDGFDFKAGQFLTVRFSIDGQTASRCYSVSSAPEATGYLEISVKRQGQVSGLLHATVRPGSLLDVMRPSGGFVYPADDHRPITLLAGGVGITPLMSMLRHSLLADPTRPVNLLYSVRTHKDIAFREELGWIAQRHRMAKVVVATSEEPASASYLSGMINRELLASQVEDLRDNIFLLCGPPPMIEAMKRILVDLGVSPDQVRFEAFAAAVAFANARAAGEAPIVEVATPVEPAAAAATGGFRLRLVLSGQTLPANGSHTLLETCEAAGIPLPSACRAGVCGTCRSRIVDGQVRCESSLLDESERAQGYILPCVSWPTSDCALEA